MGLGVLLLVLVFQLRGSMLEELAGGLEQSSPNFFVIDIQPEQRSGVTALLRAAGHPPEKMVPLVRSRLSSIKGIAVTKLYPEPAKAPWAITHDYNLSYRDGLKSTETLVAEGSGRARRRSRQPRSRLRRRRRSGWGIEVGDRLGLDVQGLEVAQVTSLRRVRWSSMRPNFFMLFPPGVLEHAPQTDFAVAQTPRCSGSKQNATNLHPQSFWSAASRRSRQRALIA